MIQNRNYEFRSGFSIDLGTTKTAVACSFDTGISTPVSIKNSLATPSVLSFNANSLAVGNEVETNLNVTDPPREKLYIALTMIAALCHGALLPLWTILFGDNMERVSDITQETATTIIGGLA